MLLITSHLVWQNLNFKDKMPPLTPQRVRLSLKKRQGFITGEFCKVHERKKPFVCKFCYVRFDKKIWKSRRVLFMKEKSLLFVKFAMWDLIKKSEWQVQFCSWNTEVLFCKLCNGIFNEMNFTKLNFIGVLLVSHSHQKMKPQLVEK